MNLLEVLKTKNYEVIKEDDHFLIDCLDPDFIIKVDATCEVWHNFDSTKELSFLDVNSVEYLEDSQFQEEITEECKEYISVLIKNKLIENE